MVVEAKITRNSHLEINSLGQTCSSRGEQIRLLQQQLRDLNEEFPGERRKSYELRNPDYIIRRTEIEKNLDKLVTNQRQDRGRIRSILS